MAGESACGQTPFSRRLMRFQCSRDIYVCAQAQAQLLRAAVGCSGASPLWLFWIIFIQAEACLKPLVLVWNALVRGGSALGNSCADSRVAGTFGRAQVLLEHVMCKRSFPLFGKRSLCI